VTDLASPDRKAARLDDEDYRRLAAFRRALRSFLAFSEGAARRVGLTPRQHQALLSLRGLPKGHKPTVGAVAEHLLIQPHSALELVNRLEAAGLVSRADDPEDGRNVLLSLTPAGMAALEALSASHLSELRQTGPLLLDLLARIADSHREG
jgi:DNA-binding MarR family transcriptional regulator